MATVKSLHDGPIREVWLIVDTDQLPLPQDAEEIVKLHATAALHQIKRDLDE
jgi:hypothetical protein